MQLLFVVKIYKRINYSFRVQNLINFPQFLFNIYLKSKPELFNKNSDNNHRLGIFSTTLVFSYPISYLMKYLNTDHV